MKSNVTSENDEYVEARTDWGEPTGGRLIAVMCESGLSPSHPQIDGPRPVLLRVYLTFLPFLESSLGGDWALGTLSASV